MGADVVRVERPAGDESRGMPPLVNGERAPCQALDGEGIGAGGEAVVHGGRDANLTTLEHLSQPGCARIRPPYSPAA